MATLANDVLNVSVPHKLGRAEARRRVASGLGRASGSPLPITIREKWQDGAEDDRLDFTAEALGQTLAGWAVVGEERVELNVKLPWLLAKLAAKLRPQLEQLGAGRAQTPRPRRPAREAVIRRRVGFSPPSGLVARRAAERAADFRRRPVEGWENQASRLTRRTLRSGRRG